MAKKQNAYLARQEAITKAYQDKTERVIKQFMLDTCMIALHRELGFGYRRIMRFVEKWGPIYTEYYQALNANRTEADYLRAKMDEELHRIFDGHSDIVEFEDRYDELRKVTYEPKKR